MRSVTEIILITGSFEIPFNLSFWENLPSCSEEMQALKCVANSSLLI